MVRFAHPGGSRLSAANAAFVLGHLSRKHGHGVAWKHAFVVDKVKPHAVRLVIPRDGSVPDVLPWQSLRKCTFAAHHFQRDDLPLPVVDDSCTPLIPPEAPDETQVTRPASDPPDPAVSDTDGYSEWTADKVYPIERIVGAEMIGGGWRLQVKWLGFPQPTPEPMNKILKQMKNHPEILEQIDHCKNEWFLAITLLLPGPHSVRPQRSRSPRGCSLPATVTSRADSCSILPS